MVPPIPYNPTRTALFHPARERYFFAYPPYENTVALCAEFSRLVYFGRSGEIDKRQLSRFLGDRFDLRTVADVKNPRRFWSKMTTSWSLSFVGPKVVIFSMCWPTWIVFSVTGVFEVNPWAGCTVDSPERLVSYCPY